MNLLGVSALDVTLILAAALALSWLLRRRSAALRHAVLAAGILSAALAPLLEALLPPWPLPIVSAVPAALQSSGVRFAAESASAAPLTIAATAPARAVDWNAVVFALWAAGALFGLAGLATGLMRLNRIIRRCAPIDRGRWRDVADELARDHALRPIALLQSVERDLLVTCGVIRPAIVLPSGCDGWTDARRRVVLAHEIAHIRRRDWATQMLAEGVRALFWFHPLAWIACRRLRQESEYACDDAVIARGIEPTDYATHLLDVARHVVGERAIWAAAPAIANPSTLERRISVMLNAQRNRDPLTRRSAALVLGAALALAVPVIAMSTADQAPARPALIADVALPGPVTPGDGPRSSDATALPRVAAPAAAAAGAAAPPQEKPASISGTLYDPLGGLLPGVALTLTDQGVGVTYAATTDRDGSFAFSELQPATYELRAVLPGFAAVSTVMPIGPGASLDRQITMPIGSLQETITVGCTYSPGPSAPPPPRVLQPRPRATAPQPTGASPFNGGIGGQIRAPRQIAKSNPICPNHVGVDTVVILSARVGIDGYLSDLKVLRSDEKLGPEVADSAIDAVRLWQYTPTLLNGVPVEANILVTVLYDWR